MRRPGDAILLTFALMAFVILAVRAGEVTVIGHNVFQLVNGLPDGLNGIFSFLYNFGALWIAAVAAGLALLVRRNVLLALSLGLSGVTAWALAQLLVWWIDSDQATLPSDLAATGVTSSFPLVRTAVAVSLATAALPYVIRPIRIFAWVLAGLVGVAALYLAEGLPGDVMGGAVLGFAAARMVMLVIGAPAERPTANQVREALAVMHIDAVEVVEADLHLNGAVEMMAVTADGRHLVARVLGRDQRDASVLAKSWRWITQKDFQPNFFVTRVSEVEHEAYVTLLAERAGAGVPDVVAAGAAGADAAMLVEAYPSGRPLHHLAGDEITRR